MQVFIWFDVLHPVCMMAHSNQLQKDHYVTFSSAEAQKRAESKGQKKGQQFLLTLGILWKKKGEYVLMRELIFFPLWDLNKTWTSILSSNWNFTEGSSHTYQWKHTKSNTQTLNYLYLQKKQLCRIVVNCI